MKERFSALWKRIAGFRYVLLVAAVGLALLVWPTGTSAAAQTVGATPEEARLAALLTQIEGVGDAQVMLSESGAVIVSRGADSASVRLAITQAVRCYTGLGANQVTIFKME